MGGAQDRHHKSSKKFIWVVIKRVIRTPLLNIFGEFIIYMNAWFMYLGMGGGGGVQKIHGS